MKILPKEEKFFQLFSQQTQCIAEAAKLLTAAVLAGTSQLGQYVAQVRDLEHRGDELTHEIMTRLNQTFLTPSTALATAPTTPRRPWGSWPAP
jgi:hypothetical protein